MIGVYEIGGAIPVAISTLRTILEHTAPSGLRTEIVEAYIAILDVETSTQEGLEWVRKSAAGTGTAATEEATTPGDVAYGGSGRYNMTAEGTISDTFPARGFNIVGDGYVYQPVPAARIGTDEGGILGVRFQAAPEAAIVVSALFVVRVY